MRKSDIERLKKALEKEMDRILADEKKLEEALGDRAVTVSGYLLLHQTEKLGKLTTVLTGLTIILAVLAAPPFIQFLRSVFK